MRNSERPSGRTGEAAFKRQSESVGDRRVQVRHGERHIDRGEPFLVGLAEHLAAADAAARQPDAVRERVMIPARVRLPAPPGGLHLVPGPPEPQGLPGLRPAHGTARLAWNLIMTLAVVAVTAGGLYLGYQKLTALLAKL